MSSRSAIQILKSAAALISVFECTMLYSQDSVFAKYGLETTDSTEYAVRVNDNDENRLINVSKYIPSVVLDIRYATDNNFMKRKMYPRAAAYLCKAAADSLRAVQQSLNKRGLGLKLFDAYRPYTTTVAFYETYRDTTYVASPYSGSRHNRGCAVDISIIDLKSGKEIDMPTEFDAFSESAHAQYGKLPGRVIRNRKILQKVMTEHGFEIYPAEWWHFDFRGWNKYPVLDVKFEQLN